MFRRPRCVVDAAVCSREARIAWQKKKKKRPDMCSALAIILDLVHRDGMRLLHRWCVCGAASFMHVGNRHNVTILDTIL